MAGGKIKTKVNRRYRPYIIPQV